MTHVGVRQSPAQIDRVTRTVYSALWASWADATGFISELTSASGLLRRTRGNPLVGPMAWRRRLGGKFGPNLELPAGTYSDDTQLRLATCRAVGVRGFDVEAFARVELPLWDSYALGGGRASKAAAQGLRRANAVWYSPDYDGWRDSGGNGAVMRIQPHAWAEPHPDVPGPWIADLVANVVCTHSHPRAILPAVMHALALGRTLTSGEIPGPDTWQVLIGMASDSLQYFKYKPELYDYWLARYDETARDANETIFLSRWRETVDEIIDLIGIVVPLALELQAAGSPPSRRAKPEELDVIYSHIVRQLDLAQPSRRGTGTNTFVAALAVAWALQQDASAAVLTTCRAVGTDTDTIATVVGALTGACSTMPPPAWEGAPGLATDMTLPRTDDSEYQIAEAVRLASLASGMASSESFPYPDLLTWVPPKSQLDAVATHDGRRVLVGLAFAEPVGEALVDQRDQVWQWHLLEFGQHVLLKTRLELAPVRAEQLPRQGHVPSRDRDVVRDVRPMPKAALKSIEERRRRDALATLPDHRGKSRDDAKPNSQERITNSVNATGESGEGRISQENNLGGAQAELALFEQIDTSESLSPRHSERLPGNLEGRLAWVTKNIDDDLAVGYFIRRCAQDLSFEEYVAATAVLRERLAFSKGETKR